MLGNALIQPSISHLRAIYWSTVKHWMKINFQSLETIANVCPISICLSLHPFILVDWNIYVHLPSSPFSLWYFLCMEDWRGGGPSGGTCFLDSDELPREVVTLYFCFELIEILFSHPISCANVIYISMGIFSYYMLIDYVRLSANISWIYYMLGCFCCLGQV